MTVDDAIHSTSPPAARAKPKSVLFKRLFGYAFAAVCLVWVFHDVELGEIASHMKTITWGFVGAAVACDIVSYLCQGFRWKMLLRPAGELSVIRATQAIYVGLFANEILPLRFGEIARMYLVSRWLRVPFMAIVPSSVVERMLDGTWLALAVGLAALFVPLPHELIVGEEVLGGIVLALTAAFAWAVFKKERTLRPDNAGRRSRGLGFLTRIVTDTAVGLRRIGFSRNLLLAAVASAGVLACQIVAFWLVMVAMGIPLDVWQGAVAMLIVYMGTAIPNTPSNVGSYQFFTVVALAVFGVDKPTAASFSVVVFVVLTVPLWIIGVVALRRTGISLSSLRAEAAKLARVRR